MARGQDSRNHPNRRVGREHVDNYWKSFRDRSFYGETGAIPYHLNEPYQITPSSRSLDRSFTNVELERINNPEEYSKRMGNVSLFDPKEYEMAHKKDWQL
jgi:hypothetical protein